METNTYNALGILFKGGPLMLPLLACSILALTIIFERLRFFKTLLGQQEVMQIKIRQLIGQGQMREAAEACEAQATPLAKIFKAGILKFGSTAAEIKNAMTEEAELEIPILEGNLGFLAVLGQSAILLGLLGTALGLCNAFYTIEQHSRALAPITTADFATGLWQALLTTVAGLSLAIPIFWAYHFLTHRVQLMIRDWERSATDLAQTLISLTENETTPKQRLNDSFIET